jgi:nucleotide-binding universal stress UspA family protein
LRPRAANHLVRVRAIADAPIDARIEDSPRSAPVEMSITQTSSPAPIWDRVVCAIDQAPLSVHAARVAASLMPATACLTLCSVVGPDEGGPLDEEARTREAQDALDRAQGQIQPVHDAELHLREGPPISRLLDELVSERATLVAVGSHARGQAGLGSVATAILHEAPCSVLIAYAEDAGDGEVVVGFDGSGGARRALAVGRALSARLSLALRVLVATGDPRAPGAGWSREELGPELAMSEDPRTAVEALTDASTAARLLILGSRHLPAALALSSVSEQAAQHARCPVLVVR